MHQSLWRRLFAAGVTSALLGLCSVAWPASTLAQAAGPVTWNVTAGTASPNQAYMGMGFYPEVLTIDAGDTVTWTVPGSEPHTVTFLNGVQPPPPTSPAAAAPVGGSTCCTLGQEVSSGFLLNGQSYSLTFPTPGVYVYQCLLHPGMEGVIIVQQPGAPYPLTASAASQEGQQQAAADIAAAQAAATGYQVATTPGPNGSTVYHVASGVSPAETTSLTLSPQAGSSVAGSAYLSVGPGGLTVTLSVYGLANGVTYTASLENGVCGSDQGSFASLGTLTGDSQGNASGTTQVAGVYGIPEAGWFVRLANGPTVVACGNVTYANGTVMRFVPTVLYVHQGDTVVWTNDSPQEIHTVTFLAPAQNAPPYPSAAAATPAGGNQVTGPGFYNSGVLAPGQSYSLTFTAPGIYLYRCLLHDDMGMQGAVVVAPATPPSFNDLSGYDWAAGAINDLAGKGLVTGEAPSSFAPGVAVTRAEFAKLLLLAVGDPPGLRTSSFSDVAPGAWYAQYVTGAADAGLMSPTSSTTFSPEGLLTRQDMAAMVASALGLSGTTSLPFTDASQIAPNDLPGVEALVAAGFLYGYPDGTFRPTAVVTRAEAALVIAHILALR